MWQERQLIIGVQIDGLLNLRHGERCVLLLSCWLLAHVPGLCWALQFWSDFVSSHAARVREASRAVHFQSVGLVAGNGTVVAPGGTAARGEVVVKRPSPRYS